MIYHFKEISANLNASSPLVRKTFKRIYAPITCLFLKPAGGEAYGFLTAAALAVDLVKDIDEALLALWKATHCHDEEGPYENWDSETIENIIEWAYQDQYSSWLSCEYRSPEGFIWLLLSGAQETVRAQHELHKPLNPPFYYPDEELVSSVGLETLDYVSLETLQVILHDEWNYSEGLFQHRNYWFYVSWGTNA